MSCCSQSEFDCKLITFLKNRCGSKITSTKRCKPKPRSNGKTASSICSRKDACEVTSKGNSDNFAARNWRKRVAQHKSYGTNSFEMLSTSKLGGKYSISSCKGLEKNAGGDMGAQKPDKRRKRKRRKKNMEQDEASRLQRRTRYLLIKMKLEQNLIDAYSGEGWKGQSREKIKPENELQRAKKQIVKCQLGIRDAIRQLHLLSSEGCIEDSVIAPDGSVFHEHIFCAKCKSRDAFPDNDIILCDGTCNCAFHQKCLEPPLATEKIPPGDQGWFCNFCECKMEILEAINAHLGTHFPANSNWQDIFKEQAALVDGGIESLNQEEEWPSDDSEDDDYDPERNDKSCSCSGEGTEENISDDASSSSILFWSSGDDVSLKSGRQVNDETPNGDSPQGKNRSRGSDNDFIDSLTSVDSDEITGRRRQRRDVDYKKLHDEMFGKDDHETTQLSEDEDWGPGRRKRREKESDVANALMTLCVNEDRRSTVVPMESKEKPYSVSDRKIFRIPPSAVEKLREAFSENELPSRAVKENLSQQLGLASEKAESIQQLQSPIPKESGGEIVKINPVNQVGSVDNRCLVLSATKVNVPKKIRKVHQRKKPVSVATASKTKQHKKAGNALPSGMSQVRPGRSNGLSLKKQINSLKGKNALDKRVQPQCRIGTSKVNEMKNKEHLYLTELERLCCLQNKIERLKALSRICNDKTHVSDEILDKQQVIYVPVAEVREKCDFR
ncbi:pathogenesis-related homeodomain protein isoform X3 [Telopea speciosissima]|uniref:pathogenesis-related homeodomain protein isoform X3 n=1 Tax=Telopea speciosissima TaxID=54955 RepID=UPI001CC6EC34|nr:pathogenesis-related homeodomain protein isoform X3 [Telopea speciosissima]